MLRFLEPGSGKKIEKISSTYLTLYMEILAQIDTLRMGKVPVLSKD